MTPYRFDIEQGPSAEQLEFLQSKHLRIATPIYGGRPELEYMHSIIKLQNLCTNWGLNTSFDSIMISFDFTGGESLIQRARNTLAHRFLHESDATHLMFIDADIGFQPQYPFEMLLTEREVIGATYPRKLMDWDKVVEAVKRGVSAEMLSHCSGEHVFGDSKIRNHAIQRSIPYPINYIPTGFLQISRGALETYKAHYSDEWYWQPGTKCTQKAWEFFPVAINKATRNLESEDYCFTRRINELGVETFMAPWVDLAHVGKWVFDGCLFCSNGQMIHKDKL